MHLPTRNTKAAVSMEPAPDMPELVDADGPGNRGNVLARIFHTLS